MRDRFGRKIRTLRLSVTDRCNLRCLYCSPGEGAPGAKELLTFDEILRVAGVAALIGIRNLRLTGGEPLLRPGLEGLVRSLRAVPGVERISLTTNGILLDAHAGDLKVAGLDHVNLSLDTLRRETFLRLTGSDCWDRVWRGLAAAEDARFAALKVNVVVLAGVNEDEVRDFVDLARDRTIHVRFIEHMGLGRFDSAPVVPADELMRRIRRVYPAASPYGGPDGSGPAQYLGIPGFRGSVGFISPVSEKFCAACDRMRLLADGRLKPCLLVEDFVDLMAVLRSGGSDGAIRDALRRAVLSKPEGHPGSRSSGMHLVGG